MKGPEMSTFENSAGAPVAATSTSAAPQPGPRPSPVEYVYRTEQAALALASSAGLDIADLAHAVVDMADRLHRQCGNPSAVCIVTMAGRIEALANGANSALMDVEPVNDILGRLYECRAAQESAA